MAIHRTHSARESDLNGRRLYSTLFNVCISYLLCSLLFVSFIDGSQERLCQCVRSPCECMRACWMEYTGINTHALPMIHCPIAISVVGLPFGKINMNVRHVLHSATQHSKPSLGLLVIHIFCAYDSKMGFRCVGLSKHAHSSNTELFGVTFWFYNWARACFLT